MNTQAKKNDQYIMRHVKMIPDQRKDDINKYDRR